MIISPWLIYFASIADNIHSAFATIGFFSAIGFAILTFIYFILAQDEEALIEVLSPYRWGLGIFAFLCIMIAVLTPSSNSVYKIIIIPAVINSQVVQKLPDELQQFIEQELKIKEKK